MDVIGGLLKALLDKDDDVWIDTLVGVRKYRNPDTGRLDPEKTKNDYAFVNATTGEYIYDKSKLPKNANVEWNELRYKQQMKDLK